MRVVSFLSLGAAILSMLCASLLATETPPTPPHVPRKSDDGKVVFLNGAESDGHGRLAIRSQGKRCQGSIILPNGTEMGPFPLSQLVLVSPRERDPAPILAPRSQLNTGVPSRRQSSADADTSPTKRLRKLRGGNAIQTCERVINHASPEHDVASTSNDLTSSALTANEDNEALLRVEVTLCATEGEISNGIIHDAPDLISTQINESSSVQLISTDAEVSADIIHDAPGLNSAQINESSSAPIDESDSDDSSLDKNELSVKYGLAKSVSEILKSKVC